MGIFKIYQTKSDMFELNIPLCQQSETIAICNSLIICFTYFLKPSFLTTSRYFATSFLAK